MGVPEIEAFPTHLAQEANVSPSTQNQAFNAERNLRMAKIRQKVAGCFRSWRGAQTVCHIRGDISTMRKEGYSVLDDLTSVVAGRPLMPQLQA
jgi:hypothetical protein